MRNKKRLWPCLSLFVTFVPNAFGLGEMCAKYHYTGSQYAVVEASTPVYEKVTLNTAHPTFTSNTKHKFIDKLIEPVKNMMGTLMKHVVTVKLKEGSTKTFLIQDTGQKCSDKRTGQHYFVQVSDVTDPSKEIDSKRICIEANRPLQMLGINIEVTDEGLKVMNGTPNCE